MLYCPLLSILRFRKLQLIFNLPLPKFHLCRLVIFAHITVLGWLPPSPKLPSHYCVSLSVLQIICWQTVYLSKDLFGAFINFCTPLYRPASTNGQVQCAPVLCAAYGCPRHSTASTAPLANSPPLRAPLYLPRLVVDPFVVAFYIIYACLIFCTFSLVFLCAALCVCFCVCFCVCVSVCVGVGLCVARPLLAPSKYFNKFYNFLSEPKRVQPHRFIVAPSPRL